VRFGPIVPGPPDRRGHCPTCHQKHPPPKPDGWGEFLDWWDCWTCNHCSADICNMPLSVGRNATTTCYVKHMEAMHPDVYRPTETER